MSKLNDLKHPAYTICSHTLQSGVYHDSRNRVDVVYTPGTLFELEGT